MPMASSITTAVQNRLDGSEARLHELLQTLIRCHPTYGSAGQAQALGVLADRLTRLGLAPRLERIDDDLLRSCELHVDVPAFGEDFGSYFGRERFNLVAERSFGAGGSRILLNGHVDVEFVTAPASWSAPDGWRSGDRTGERIYGRGAADMLAGVACYVHVLDALSPYLAEAKGGLGIEFVIDEELGGNGTLARRLTASEQPYDICLIAEPTDYTVCTGTFGFHQFRVRCTGEAVHMAYADEWSNANRSAAEVIRSLEQLNDELVGRIGAIRPTRHVLAGMISGGTDAAVPADVCDLLVTLALPVELDGPVIEQELARALQHIGPPDRPPSVQPYGVSFPGSRNTLPHAADRIVAAGQEAGVRLEVADFPSACDARLLEAFGIPTLVYGPGELSVAHGADEYVTVGQLRDYCASLSRFLISEWQLDG